MCSPFCRKPGCSSAISISIFSFILSWMILRSTYRLHPTSVWYQWCHTIVDTYFGITVLVNGNESGRSPVLRIFACLPNVHYQFVHRVATLYSPSLSNSAGISSGPAAFPGFIDLIVLSTSSSEGMGSRLSPILAGSCPLFPGSECRFWHYSLERFIICGSSVSVCP